MYGLNKPPPINIQNACTIRVKNGNFYKQYCLGLMHSHSHAFSTPCKVLKINLLQTLKHLSPQHSHLSKNKRVHLFLVCTLQNAVFGRESLNVVNASVKRSSVSLLVITKPRRRPPHRLQSDRSVSSIIQRLRDRDSLTIFTLSILNIKNNL